MFFVDHQVPDVILLQIIVVDDHHIADHCLAAENAKRRTLVAVHVGLREAPDRVRDEFALPLAELQAECLQKVVFVDFFQMDAVHIVPPVSAEDHRVWVSSCSSLFLAYLLFFRILNIPFPVDMQLLYHTIFKM